MENKTDNREIIELEQQASSSVSRSTRKFVILLGVIGIALIALHCSPAREILSSIGKFKTDIRSLGAMAPLLFFIGATILATIGVPRLGLTFAASVVFGLQVGLLVGIASTLAGSYFTFCIARWCGREWAQRMAAKSQHFSFLMRNQSLATVFLIRQLPITNIVINLLFSLTDMRHTTFLIGSLVGFLPSALVVALSGSSLGKTSSQISFFQFSLAGIIVIVTILTVRRLKKVWSLDYGNQHT